MDRPRIWQDDAACRGWDTELFFPAADPGRAAQVPAELVVVCGGCPVQVECLGHALRTPEEHGIWGGTTGKQREAMLRRRVRATCPACTGRSLRRAARQQVCVDCGTSWVAARPTAPSGRHRPKLAAA